MAIPIGLALTYASLYMSPAQNETANRLALQGLVTWVNYPELGKPQMAIWTSSAPSWAAFDPTIPQEPKQPPPPKPKG